MSDSESEGFQSADDAGGWTSGSDFEPDLEPRMVERSHTVQQFLSEVKTNSTKVTATVDSHPQTMESEEVEPVEKVAETSSKETTSELLTSVTDSTENPAKSDKEEPSSENAIVFTEDPASSTEDPKNTPDSDIEESPHENAAAVTEKQGKDVQSAENANSAHLVLDRLAETSRNADSGSSGWSSWGSWGSSLITTAATSVATFTNQVGEGITTVMESVEQGLGVPAAETLAVQKISEDKSSERIAPSQLEPAATTGKFSMQPASETTDVEAGDGWDNDWDDWGNDNEVIQDPESKKEILSETNAKRDNRESTEREHIPTPAQSSSLPFGSLLQGVSALTVALESTSSKVITSGLDTLELLGKKTMDIIQEGDPGLKKKRAALLSQKPNLSQVLRDAKERVIAAGHESSTPEDIEEENVSVMYASYFDDFQGNVHLEALEMLSEQYRNKVQATLTLLEGEQYRTAQKALTHLEDKCTLPERDDSEVGESIDDFPDLIKSCLSEVQLEMIAAKLCTYQLEARNRLQKCGDVKDKKAIHKASIETLANMTAKSVESLHKITELILSQRPDNLDLHVDVCLRFVGLLCAEMNVMSEGYATCLTKAAEASLESSSAETTNVYLEAANSCTYIEDAFRLMVPIFQFLCVNRDSF